MTARLPAATMFALLVSLFVVPGLTTAAETRDAKYGKNIVLQFQLPAETIEKLNAHKVEKPAPNASTVDWYGPATPLKSSGNPYNIVVTVSGTAKAEGEITSLWQAGWRLEDGVSQLTAIGGLGQSKAKAGEKVTMTAAARPTSFKEDRNAAPALSLVSVKNIDIQGVRVEVWSGIGSTTWLDMLAGSWYVLVAGMMFVLWWFWFRPR
jgi:hypothetical protein